VKLAETGNDQIKEIEDLTALKKEMVKEARRGLAAAEDELSYTVIRAPFPGDVLTDATYVRDGRVNGLGLAELRKRLPFAHLDEFAKTPVVRDFANLLTVADICRFVANESN
jgi:hypothetical protein